jgi:carbamoyltransferase
MITWGISANSHDAALAVFVGEKLVFASHSERFSGKKNDRDLDLQMITYARQHFGGAPDKVVWYEQPFKKTLRQLYAGQGWKRRDNDIEIYMARYDINAPIEYVGHHHSHAAAGYYTSGFDDACVLVIDAIGEFETMTIWKGQGDKLIKVWSKSYPHSIGLFYSAMTQRIGLKPNEDEYITMGMSAYGRQDLSNDMITDIVDNFENNGRPAANGISAAEYRLDYPRLYYYLHQCKQKRLACMSNQISKKIEHSEERQDHENLMHR